MDYDSRLAVSFYKEVATINEKHKVFLVQHLESKKFYVKKILNVYNFNVYTQLLSSHIAGLPQIECLHEENGTLTVIEEYVSGMTLSEILENKGALSVEIVMRYARALCNIVEQLHSLQPPVIHRDIKPSNIIITPRGQVILLDLNAARSDIKKEEDTVLLGTKGYAAPEQYGFGSSNVQTDIYAIGMLMNTCLWGEFHSDIFQDVSISSIIKRCTELDPSDRYKSVFQLSEALGVKGETTSADSRSWRRFLPPGFRTGSVGNMIIATPIYAIILWLSLTLEVKDTYGYALIFERWMCLIIFLSLIACVTNYLDIQSSFPLCNSKKRFVRILGVILLTISVAVLLFGIMIFVETSLLE